jgi:cell division protein FtsW (lipid II flippase)
VIDTNQYYPYFDTNRYLPKNTDYNDLIFPVVGEDFGFRPEALFSVLLLAVIVALALAWRVRRKWLKRKP